MGNETCDSTRATPTSLLRSCQRLETFECQGHPLATSTGQGSLYVLFHRSRHPSVDPSRVRTRRRGARGGRVEAPSFGSDWWNGDPNAERTGDEEFVRIDTLLNLETLVLGSPLPRNKEDVSARIYFSLSFGLPFRGGVGSGPGRGLQWSTSTQGVGGPRVPCTVSLLRFQFPFSIRLSPNLVLSLTVTVTIRRSFSTVLSKVITIAVQTGPTPLSSPSVNPRIPLSSPFGCLSRNETPGLPYTGHPRGPHRHLRNIHRVTPSLPHPTRLL